jgi:large conductance mechanosensitive channel
MINEFKEFISRGNVIDLAVGIIIGAAFTGIVKSIVADLINPFVSLLSAGIDVSGLFIPLSTQSFDSLTAAEAVGIGVFAYGRFLMAVIHFFFVAVVLFFLVRGINSFRRKQEAEEQVEAESKGPTQEELLVEIRDLLRQNDKLI